MNRNWIFIALALIAAFFIVYQAQGEGVDSTDLTDLDLDSSGDATVDTANSTNPLFNALASAIQAAENVAGFHNNPLALTAPAADQVGADYTPNTTGGVVVNFPTLQDGLNAGLSFLTEFVNNHSDLSISQAISTYIAGPNAASTISGAATGIYPASIQNYINQVASALGVSNPNGTTIGSALGL